MDQTIISKLSGSIGAYHRCIESGNEEWESKHLDAIQDIQKNRLPSGSGIDSGTVVNVEESTENKITMNVSFHHMNDCGMYVGWVDYKLVITPTFSGIDIDISSDVGNEEFIPDAALDDMGVEKWNIDSTKDYLIDVFEICLKEGI